MKQIATIKTNLLIILSISLVSCLSQEITFKVSYERDINFEDGRKDYRSYLQENDKRMIFFEGGFVDDTIFLLSEKENEVIANSDESNNYTGVSYQLTKRNVKIKINSSIYEFSVDSGYHLIHINKISDTIFINISNNPKLYE